MICTFRARGIQLAEVPARKLAMARAAGDRKPNVCISSITHQGLRPGVHSRRECAAGVAPNPCLEGFQPAGAETRPGELASRTLDTNAHPKVSIRTSSA